jgi:ABC-type amino acid transport substrate-binding protein
VRSKLRHDGAPGNGRFLHPDVPRRGERDLTHQHAGPHLRGLAGKRVGVLEGTTTERTLRAAIQDLGLRSTVVTVVDHRGGFNMLAEDKLDAYFADRGIILAILREGGRPGFDVSRQYFSYETYALALPRDDGAFRLLVDRTLARLYRTGGIDAVLEKTFGKGQPHELLKAMILINSLPEK